MACNTSRALVRHATFLLRITTLRESRPIRDTILWYTEIEAEDGRSIQDEQG